MEIKQKTQLASTISRQKAQNYHHWHIVMYNVYCRNLIKRNLRILVKKLSNKNPKKESVKLATSRTEAL